MGGACAQTTERETEISSPFKRFAGIERERVRGLGIELPLFVYLERNSFQAVIDIDGIFYDDGACGVVRIFVFRWFWTNNAQALVN